MSQLPKVSCVCPTFSRAYLLEEAIESFLRQDYEGEKELIVCNDFTKQHFVFEHPEVKIINLSNRASNLGEKRNISYSHATGDWFLTWGDDDIHLPKRISRMVNAAISMNTEFLYEGPFYIISNNVIKYESGKMAGPNIVSKKLFYEVGGIPEKNCGEDFAFNDLVKKKIKILPVCNDEPQFIYRWSSGRAHISQFIKETNKPKNDWDLMLEMAESYILKGMEPSGIVNLTPHWKKDWVKEVENINITEKISNPPNQLIKVEVKKVNLKNSNQNNLMMTKKSSNIFNIDNKKLKSSLQKNKRR
jgi:glycosyltransferase involved in cell wall biosynthesis